MDENSFDSFETNAENTESNKGDSEAGDRVAGSGKGSGSGQGAGIGKGSGSDRWTSGGIGTGSGQGTGSGKGSGSGRKGKLLFALLILFAIIAVVFGAFRLKQTSDYGRKDAKASGSHADVELKLSESQKYEEKGDGKILSGVEIAKKIRPSVVGLICSVNGGRYSGQGSAIVMGKSKDGDYTYFITCAHLISGSDLRAKVITEDKKEYKAETVGFDVRSDIGVIRVKGGSFVPAEFGNSDILQVGEPVYAVGNPGGIEYFGSFTSGVISAINRFTTSQESKAYAMECIQHDAAINPGNSGGALVNARGQVIGINSSKIAEESYEGMGFAIPISAAKKTVDEIVSKGQLQSRPMLGIEYLPASKHRKFELILRENNLPEGSIVIVSIAEGSSFKGTKVRAGDIIIEVDGRKLEDSSDLLNIIQSSKVGDELELKIARPKNKKGLFDDIKRVFDDSSGGIEKFTVKIRLVEYKV